MATPLEVGVVLKNWFAVQSISRRILIVGVVAGSALGIYAFTIHVKEGSMDLLYGRLTEEDAGAIVDRLKAKNIMYEVRQDGSIFVPKEMKYELRAELAAEGIPYGGGGMGFELFDKSQIGMTSYHQKVNYQRALRGELVRTINSLSVVKSSRVTIQEPEPSPFVEEEKPPTATVVVELEQGQRLNAAQLRGVSHIVAAAVPGLIPDNVKIVNNRGELLSGSESVKMVDESSQQLIHQRNYETKLKGDIETLLERWFGRGHVVAQVGATFDFSQTEETSEEYEEDNKVVTSEKITAAPHEGGLAPSPSGTPGTPPAAPDAKSKTLGAAIGLAANEGAPITSTKEYMPGKRVKKLKTPVGKLTKLQVAVLVDKSYGVDPKSKDASAKSKTDEDLAAEKKMALDAVKNAMGFSDDRGDAAEVSFVPFDKTLIPIPEEAPAVVVTWRDTGEYWLQRLTMPVVLLISVYLLVFMVLRPFLKFLDRQQAAARVADARLKTVAELEASLDPEQRAALGMDETQASLGGDLLKRREQNSVSGQVEAMAKNDPARSAKMLKSWLGS